ncbi:MAG: hypothetical protein NVV82_20465 [Sporocytophaga sp.]|nr:hypothetical protein [Sporocytophaga sp.]
MENSIIDKNIFMKVQQCTKAGYLMYNNPELKSDNPFLDTFYRRYLRVKELAKELFPDGYFGISGEYEKFESFVKFTDFLLFRGECQFDIRCLFPSWRKAV